MMADKPDWFKMNPAQFLADATVDAMTTEELGAAFRLLCRQWIDGWIPDDVLILGRLCRLDDKAMAKAWPMVQRLFPVIEDGRRANRFMWEERELVISAMKKRQDDGREAVKRRWAAMRTAKEGYRSPIANLIQDTDTEEESEPEGEKEERTTCPEAVKPPSGPAVVVLPCVGKGLKEWPVTQALLDDWKDAYPGLDPLSEAKRMRLWLEQNPRRGKTYVGMGRFTTSWLSRAQDSARPSTTNQGANHAATHRHARRDAALKAQLSDTGGHTMSGLPEPNVAGPEEPW
jgi:uncharacterized protein YdaU (DUF1376 family)